MRKTLCILILLLVFANFAFGQQIAQQQQRYELLNWVNVRESPHGARGNGTTDDSVAFISACAKAINKIMYIPPGTYKLSNDVTAGATVEVWFSNGVTLSVDVGKTFAIVGKLMSSYLPTNSGAGTFDVSGATKPASLPSSVQGDMLYASAVNTWSNLVKSTDATRYLSNTGADNNPAWAQVALATGVTGTLPVTNGGTGLASTTANQILYSSASNTIAGLASGNSGVLVTDGSGVPSITTDIPTAVTIGTAYVYRAGGNDVALADGGSPTTRTVELIKSNPFPDGSSNSGILADYYDSPNFVNYTRWTSGTATQDYGVVYTALIPTDFASFPTDALSVSIRSNDKDGNVHLLYMYINDNTVDAGINGADIKPSANDTWEAKTDTPTGSYSVGHRFKIVVKMGNDEASNTVDVGRIFLTYNTR